MNEVRDNAQRARYEILVDGRLAGFAEYNMRGGRIIVVHTEVGDAYSGRGLATELVKRALDDIRRRGLLVVPVCPFVERYIERHPAYDDLVDHEIFDALNREKQ